MKSTSFTVGVWILAGFEFSKAIAFQSRSIPRQDTQCCKLFQSFSSRDDDNNHEDDKYIYSSARRGMLVRWTIPFTAALASASLYNPYYGYMAAAATPITVGEVQNLGSIFERTIRPKPPKILRPRLDKDFAVLLMRSSYDALDAIDCVPMDQFQRDFFIIRQAEYEPYVQALGPGLVQQGDLTDPYYFDFISFAQYKTINREITNDPPVVFEEKQPIEVGDDEPQKFVTAVVKRNPSITNDILASEHSRMVGSRILDRLNEVFSDTPAAIPKLRLGSRPDTETLLASLEQLVKLFLVIGFAWSGDAKVIIKGSNVDNASGTKFCLEMVSPATIWGGKGLKIQRSICSNDFLLKTATVLVNRLGYVPYSPTVDYDGNIQRSYFSVK